MIPHVGQQFGNYQLLRLLGKGGFAEVYLAQHFYIHTQAAVKILTGQMTPQEIQKFTTEAQIIASLSHPHILRVLDFGVHESIPFLVIEYAPHGTLRDRHRRGSVLPLATVLFYVKQIASALSYAHTQQLVHRDVKPENMLIDRHNHVVLSDFGIAIAAHKTASLSTQEAVGTVTYMAPEQIKGKARLASDQYSLAVVIYEWLCGTPPFDGLTSIEIAMAHLTDPPPLFQTKNATVPPMVEQVILKALEKDPQQRYASVDAFALALEQASETLPVQPPPTIPTDTFSSTYVLDFQNPTVLQPPPQKSMPTQKVETQQQSPLPGTTGSIPPNNETQQLLAPQHHISRRFVVLGLVGLTGMGIVGSSLAWLVRPTTSTANSLAATTSNTPTTTNLTPAPTTSKIPTPTTSKTPTPTTTPTSTSTTAPTPTPTTAPTPTPTTAPTPTPTTATTSLGTTLYTYTNHNAGMRALAWSPNGKRVATASDDYTAQVWDAMTGRNAIVYRGHSSYVEGVAWSPDGTYVVSGSADGTAQIWNSATGSPIYTYRGHLATYPWVNRVGWSPDGTYIVSCDQTSTVGRTATVQVWRATTGKTIVTYTGHTNGVYAVAWSPNGNFIASAGYDGTLQIWQATTGNTIATYRGNAYLFGLSWSPDNNAVAVGNSNNAVIVVNATSGNVLGTYNGHSAWVKDVAWSSDGKYIASGSDDGMVLLWNTTTGSNSYSYNGHSGHVNAVGWAASNSFIASGGDTVQVWQAE